MLVFSSEYVGIYGVKVSSNLVTQCYATVETKNYVIRVVHTNKTY